MNDEYVKILEKKIEEQDEIIAHSVTLESREIKFLEYAKNSFTFQDGISYREMTKFFDADDKPPFFTKIGIWWRKLIRNENFPIMVICFIGGAAIIAAITLGVLQQIKQTHEQKVSVQIDASMQYDTNKDNIITDDERRLKLTSFIKQHNLTINEEDLESCIRKKEYDKFVLNGEKISVDDFYDIVAPHNVENSKKDF